MRSRGPNHTHTWHDRRGVPPDLSDFDRLKDNRM